MARHVNASFQGVEKFDGEFDAATFRRAVENTAGDAALIFDKLTGENGISAGATITHEGSATGCPLGIVLVNQFIGRDLTITTPAAKDTHGGTGACVIQPYLIFLPPGETKVYVDIFGTFNPRLFAEDAAHAHCRVLSSAMAQEADVDFELVPMGDDLTMMTARITGLSSGLHVVFPILDTDPAVLGAGSNVDVGRVDSVLIHYLRLGSEQNVPPRSNENNFGVWTPGAAEGVAHRSFDEAMFVNLEAITAYELAGINRNLNGLEEYTDAWPAGGNADYTQVDHNGSGSADAADPARSRFHAHTRSLYANEPEVAFPVWAASFGSVLLLPDGTAKFSVDLAEPPTIGMLSAYAPWPKSTSLLEFIKTRCLLPDFQTAASRLKLSVLIASDASADVDQWTFTAKTLAGSGAGAAPAAMDATDCWWLATDTAIPFSPDTEQDTFVMCERSGAKGGIGELAVLAACLYFEP